MVCRGLTKCLEYRWKGFDEASAWTMRGRLYHDLLLKAFKVLYPAGVTKRAKAELERRALAGAFEHESSRQRLERNVRGGHPVSNPNMGGIVSTSARNGVLSFFDHPPS